MIAMLSRSTWVMTTSDPAGSVHGYDTYAIRGTIGQEGRSQGQFGSYPLESEMTRMRSDDEDEE